MVTGLRPKNGIGMGVSAGVGAGLVWGLAFPIPVLLHGWNAVTVTAGRYIAYGLISAIFFAVGGRQLHRLAVDHWRTALLFAVSGNVGYYLLLVIGIATVGAPATDLVIGSIPIVLALVGNWVAPVYAWRRIVIPIVLVMIGLVIVNTLEIAGTRAYNPAPTVVKLAGLIAALGAVAIWSWYALANARFLADHPDTSPAGWSTVVGVATGAVTFVAMPLAWATGQLAPSASAENISSLIVGAIILGVAVSWGGTWLWNAASSRLPPALAGLLINVETVSGFAYVYAARWQWPAAGQLIGFALVVLGVIAAPYRKPSFNGRSPGWRIRPGATDR